VDQREHQLLVLAEIGAQLLAVLRLRRVGLADRAGVQKVAVDLPVQVLAVGDDDEAVVAGELAQDLAHIEDHREALAGALGVPKHAQLAIELFSSQELVEALVDADELMVLGHHFLRVLVVEHKVLDVIQQPRLVADAGQEALDAGALFPDLRAPDLLLFIVRA
jgi:hypothetical protein